MMNERNGALYFHRTQRSTAAKTQMSSWIGLLFQLLQLKREKSQGCMSSNDPVTYCIRILNLKTFDFLG